MNIFNFISNLLLISHFCLVCLLFFIKCVKLHKCVCKWRLYIHCLYAVSVLVFLDKASAIISIFAFTPTQSFNVSSEWLIMRWWYRFGSNEFFTEPQFSYAVLHFFCISLYLCQMLIRPFLLIYASIEMVVFCVPKKSYIWIIIPCVLKI